ncbi:MAG TPA: FUSC family protein [Rickettsiales bacterium]|nr:FUSC family protein [Rickettsiales bacterium]
MPSVQFGLSVFLGTSILWFIIHVLFGGNPLWAVISLILVTEPNTGTTWASFKLRISNTIIGCLTGLLFLLVVRQQDLLLPLALAATIFVKHLFKTPTGWRVASITTAIVVTSAIADGSSATGIFVALHRVMEVFLGSAMALLIAWLIVPMQKWAIRTESPLL